MEPIIEAGAWIDVQPFTFKKDGTLIVATKGVRMFEGVWVASGTRIMGGTEAPTEIGYNVKIAQLCVIGHDSKIGAHTRIGNKVSLGGFVEIGKRSYIGQGSTIKERIKVGNCTLIGQHSNVLKDVPDNVIAYGNPCEVIEPRHGPIDYLLRRVF